MKFKKKTAMLVSFTVGALLLATTALADITNKSGYDQLKDALKMTAAQCTEKSDSFTVDLAMAMKDNGKILMTSNQTSKVDRKQNASETISSNLELNGETYSSQTYSDKTTIIRTSDGDPTYYVTEYTNERTDKSFSTNPFKEERAEDLEKIVDAVVGGLKDHVIVTENPDSSKVISGSLTEVQIPSLVNAVASFQLKHEFTGNRSSMPHLTKDVFVKEVKGTANVDKDGGLESILGSAILSGKDEQGTEHNISIEMLVKVTDINSTVVSKPDLTNKKVVKNVAKDYSNPEISNPEKYLGKFKNDILIEKDSKFVKIGERFVDITFMDNKSVRGRYYEEYKSGYEEYAGNTKDFNFDAQFEKDSRGNANFSYTSESGSIARGNIYIDDYQGKINFSFNNMNPQSAGGIMFDSSFSPDLD